MEIKVELTESYSGSMNYQVVVKPSTFGPNHSGFLLVDIDKLKEVIPLEDVQDTANEWQIFKQKSLLRVCEAKQIKKRLEAEIAELNTDMLEVCKLFEECMENLDGASEPYDTSYELAKVRSVLARAEAMQ